MKDEWSSFLNMLSLPKHVPPSLFGVNPSSLLHDNLKEAIFEMPEWLRENVQNAYTRSANYR